MLFDVNCYVSSDKTLTHIKLKPLLLNLLVWRNHYFKLLIFLL